MGGAISGRVVLYDENKVVLSILNIQKRSVIPFNEGVTEEELLFLISLQLVRLSETNIILEFHSIEFIKELQC
jgi:hypothetical protein